MWGPIQVGYGLGGLGSSPADILFALTSDVHAEHATGEGEDRFDDIAPLIGSSGAPIVFVNGDFLDLGIGGTSAGIQSQLQAALATIAQPIYWGLGNHDNAADSATDVTAQQVTDFYALVGATYDHEDLGYFTFQSAGIDYLVVNSVEVQAPTEGDYAMSETQRDWIESTLDGISGAGSQLVVMSHVDPTETSSTFHRMAAGDRAFLQGVLEKWAYESGGTLLGVFTAHEHGTNNSSQNRLRTTRNVAYINMLDGLLAGVSNIKAETYASGALKSWFLVRYNASTRALTCEDQYGGSNKIERTTAILTAPAAQSFNGSSEQYNTSIAPDSTTEMVIVGNFRNTSGTQFHGCIDSGGERFYFGIAGGTWALGYDTYQDSGVSADTSVHTFKINSNGLYIDGSLVQANVGGEITAAMDNTARFGATEVSVNTITNYAAFDLLRAEMKHNGYRTFYYPTLS